MNEAESETLSHRAALRLWPGVALVALQWIGWLVVPVVAEDASIYGVLGGLVIGPLLLAWWVFFSRAAWLDRIGGAALVVFAIAAAPGLLHESVAKGNMGFQFYLYAIPVMSLAFVAWAVTSQRWSDGFRRATMVATILFAGGSLWLVRSKGVTGDGMPQFTWRWVETAEERLLAQGTDEAIVDSVSAEARAEHPDEATGQRAPHPPALEESKPSRQGGDGGPVAPPSRLAAQEPEWPGFRGPGRDGVIPGTRIAADWSAYPPVELWRRAIGPGVSSFAVRGDLFYTHEQRGEDEIVACHRLSTGELVWRHVDTARFWDAHVGAGPRATPALGGDRVYTLGATGLLNALDAATGTVMWSRDASKDADSDEPGWGYVSSPLVVGDVLVVHIGVLVAYDLATGEPRWFGPEGGSYSSPHLMTIHGVPQILMVRHAGAASVAPADGKLLWDHDWEGIGIMQPVLTAKGDILISMIDAGAMPIGTRRLAVAHDENGWSVDERWTSFRLKPSFSQVVVHEDNAFGFDGRFVSCVGIEDGARKWKGGRYGSGQLLLLPGQDLLLVVTEQGELALVQASPEEFTELARFPAIEGKTWSQPALVGDVLLVRNGQEMAAFRLPTI